MLTITDSKDDERSEHQSTKITFYVIALITSKSVSCMVASGYIGGSESYKTASSATLVVFPLNFVSVTCYCMFQA